MTKLTNKAQSLPKDDSMLMVVVERGPYLLYGAPPMAQQFILPDKIGESWYYRRGAAYSTSEQPTALCRCGASKSKPYCDDSHASADWDPTLTAPVDRLLDDAKYYEGEQLLLSDSERYCCYARFCHPGGSVWRLTESSEDPESRDLAIREASMCPSSRLMAWGRGADTPFEFDFERSIGLLEDPQIEASAGLWLCGGIAVDREDGVRYEVRNRVVLCRCGASHNKPYCDGTHAAIKWSDGLPDEATGVELPDGELAIEDVVKG